MRYSGDAQIHLFGDRRVAASHIPDGRKLLGEVLLQAEPNGLDTLVLRHVLDDGTHITASKIGGILAISIDSPSPSEKPKEIDLDGFVVVPRAGHSAHPIDAEKPEEIIQTHQRTWRTLFFNGDAQAFKDFDRSKGTYRHIYKNGVPRGGNIDWSDARDNRISWHGPTRRYWFDHYVAPAWQYGRFVYARGVTLFDASQLVAQPRQFVVGAALNQTRLRVMLAAMNDPRLHPTGGTYNSFPQDAPISLALVELKVIEKSDGTLEVSDYTEAMTLWTQDIGGAVNPWTIAPNGDTWITMSLNADQNVYWHELQLSDTSDPILTTTIAQVDIEDGKASWKTAIDFRRDGTRSEVRQGFTYTATTSRQGYTAIEFPSPGLSDDALRDFLHARFDEAKASNTGKYTGTLQTVQCFLQVGETVVNTHRYTEVSDPYGEARDGAPNGVAFYGYSKRFIASDGHKETHIVSIDARHDAVAVSQVDVSGIVIHAPPYSEGWLTMSYNRWAVSSAPTWTDGLGSSSNVFVRVVIKDRVFQRGMPVTGDGYLTFCYAQTFSEGTAIVPEGVFTTGNAIIQDTDPALLGAQDLAYGFRLYSGVFNIADNARDAGVYPLPEIRNSFFNYTASYSAGASGYSVSSSAQRFYLHPNDSVIPADADGFLTPSNFAVDKFGNFIFSAVVPMPAYRQYDTNYYYRNIRRPKVFMSNLGDVGTVTGATPETPTFDAWASKVWVIHKDYKLPL